MARIAYRKTNGRAHDVRFVPDEYAAEDGDLFIFAGVLPSIDDLSDVPAPVAPDIGGFRRALPLAVGGPLQANQLAVAYPLFDTFLQGGDFGAAQMLLNDALAKGALTSAQMLTIVATAVKFNIPLVQP